MVAGAVLCLGLQTIAAAGESRAPTPKIKSSERKAGKPKRHTIQDLIKIALAKGKEADTSLEEAQHLGFVDGFVAFLLEFNDTENENGFDHGLFVIYEPESSPVRPLSLLWEKERVEKIGDKFRHEIHSFHSTLDGILLSAGRTEGIHPDFHRISIPISPQVEKKFKEDVAFLIQRADKLPKERRKARALVDKAD